MKNYSNTSTDKKTGLLKVSLFPERAKMYIWYSRNEIVITLAHPCPSGSCPVVQDCTEEKERYLNGMRVLIKNGARNNHTVASYHIHGKYVLIRHRKKIYYIQLPCAATEIFCGGRNIVLSEFPDF